ncbi:MAG: hypothetical protein ACLTSX_02715 [Collinsella sp.]
MRRRAHMGKQGETTPDALGGTRPRALDTRTFRPRQLARANVTSRDHQLRSHAPGSLTRDDAHPAASHPRGGTRGARARILVATGMHRAST